ncbi:YitT family protein [Fervidibacillus albus]|uniref:YitT family protein n=1 Tax=Fervidibacillus albus TaxID=2980026 RepID=A0A9E8LSP0_9BACI|nr:YitT family protein [Fervidibacillus albus]WAA08675.1 YitT family protein [Fervidibacillus albus]
MLSNMTFIGGHAVVSTNVKKIFFVIVGAFIYTIGINFFLVPANVYASGFSGLSQLLMSIFQQFFHIHVSMGIFLLLLNIPVIVLSWFKLGHAFTFYSVMSVGFTSFFLQIVPIQSVSNDIILNAVFGGTISAIGVGLTLRWGASTGGMDIITLFLSKLRDQPIGKYQLGLNSIIIFSAGMLYDWEKALYTMVALYTSSRVVDMLHTRSHKLTAMIITNKTEEMKKEIIFRLGRGITILPAQGAFSDEKREMLMVVISKYELFELKQIIKQVDGHAFTNIVHTESVYGKFRRD